MNDYNDDYNTGYEINKAFSRNAAILSYLDDLYGAGNWGTEQFEYIKEYINKNE